MQFQVVQDELEVPTPEPVAVLMIRVLDDRAYLCAREPGRTTWIYLLELGHPDGVRFFTGCGSGLGLPLIVDGALKMACGYAVVRDLPI